MRSRLRILLFGAAALLAVSVVPAHAQSAIAGVVKDATGGVMPGVTVEAASPALIEQVRSVITDSAGQYKIVDLRPGLYTVTFKLEGFQTVKREGVDLPSNFTATINAEMKVGQLEESVVVSGASPVVDVQTNNKAQVLSRDVLDAVPTAHTIQSVGQLVTGVTLTAPDVGGSQAMQQTYFTVHGLGAAQTSVLMDGMIINGLQGDGAIQTYINDAANQEMVYQTGGGNVDSPTGGVKINLVPREGGNQFHGTFFGGYESSSLQSNNLTPFLASHGVKSVDKIGTYRDINFTQGGPLEKDKIWLFGSMRFFTVNKPIANTFVSDGTFPSINACLAAVTGKGGTLCPQGVDPQHQYSGQVRLTWQVSPRNKFSAYVDRVHKSRGAAMSPLYDQTTAAEVWTSPMYMTNAAKWTSTVTNKLLVEGGYSSNIERYTNQYEPGVLQPEASLLNAQHHDVASGAYWGAGYGNLGVYPDRYNAQASASYVTGSHTFKAGFQDSWGHFHNYADLNGQLVQQYSLGQPLNVILYATPARWEDSLNANLGVYGQDIWTMKRLTLTIGGRYEYVSEMVNGQPAQLGRFANIPAFSDIQMPIWKSFSPRTAAVYDLRGNGKTALKFGYNRYESAATTTLASLYDPANGYNIRATLPWKDLNGDDIAQGAAGCAFGTPGCEINFATLPANFGKVSLATPDPNLTRPYVDQYNTGITHEIFSGVSVSFDWFHTISKDFMERNNVLRPGTYANGAVSNASYRPVTVFSPLDGTPITMYDVANAAVGRAVQYVDSTDPSLSQKYDAFEFNFNARLPHGARIFGGTATDRTIANTCSAAATNPNWLLTIGGVNYCDETNSGIPWRTQFKLGGTVPLPWYGIVVSGSLQMLPGYILGTTALTSGGAGAPNFTDMSGISAAWNITGATKYTVCPGNSASQGCVVGGLVAPGLLSALAVPLVPPGTQLTPRINQLDLSFAKRITAGRLTIEPKVDIYNALNADDYFTVASTGFAPTATAGVSAGGYLLPGSIIQGRIIRIAANLGW